MVRDLSEFSKMLKPNFSSWNEDL